MKKITTLSWPLIIGLGALALIRPLVRIIGHQVDADLGAATPIAITLVISAIWVAVVGIGKTRHPVMTLLFTGLTYAVLSIILSGILSPMIDGRLDGPLANPIAIVPMLLTNALWGLIAGGLALLIQRLRGVNPQRISNATETRKTMPHTQSNPHDPHDAEKPRTSTDEAKTDAAVQAFNARGQWPLAAEAPKTPTASQAPNATDRSPQLSQKPRNRWRTVGIGALGLLGGLLLGVVFQDILATLVTGTELTDVSFVFALVLPLFAVLGIVATIFFDRWFARRRRPEEHT